MDELISKQAAIIQLSYNKIGDDDCDVIIQRDIETIKQLPPTESKRETTTLRIGRTRNGVTMWYECEKCGEPVDKEDAFCRRCGRRIIHE